MQEKTWYYEKWVGRQATFSPSRYVKTFLFVVVDSWAKIFHFMEPKIRAIRGPPVYLLSKLRLIRLYLLFIDEASTCSDKKISPYPNGEKFNDLWHTTPVYESNEACKNKKEGTALIR